jgi:hypothetical protein
MAPMIGFTSASTQLPPKIAAKKIVLRAHMEPHRYRAAARRHGWRKAGNAPLEAVGDRTPLPAGAPGFLGAPALEFLPVWAKGHTFPTLYVFGRPRAPVQQ